MSTLTKLFHLNLLKNTFLNVSRCLSTQSVLRPSVTKLTSITNSWIWQQNNNLRLPQINQQGLNLPSGMIWNPFISELEGIAIDEPVDINVDNSKQAARLIIIRRKKMRKHKLKKLRKKMKFEWAKLRQKREWRKEKEFQAGLIQQCKTAEMFSAEQYVEERLAKLNEVIIPKYWKGRRLPEFIIREKMGLPPKKE